MGNTGHKKTGIRCVATSHFLAALFAVSGLGGCVSTSTINAEDNRVFLPALSVGINLGDGKQAASEPQTGHAVEFSIATSKGSDSQFLAAGQPPIIIGNTTFSAPQQLRDDFEFGFADISWRWRKFFAERSFGLEVAAGVGFSSLDLTVSSATRRASDHLSTWGPQGGVGLIWRMNPGNSFEARAKVFATEDILAKRYELFYASTLHENLTLRVGYAGWVVDANGELMTGFPKFGLNFSGPVLALNWDFNARN